MLNEQVIDFNTKTKQRFKIFIKKSIKLLEVEKTEFNVVGNLEAMLLKILSDFCDMKWLQCPEDCSLVKGSTGCPLCSCPEQDQALYENQKVHGKDNAINTFKLS